MTIAIILVFLAVLTISLIIAAGSHGRTKAFEHRELLFSGNTPTFATFSTIGSFLSINIIFSLIAVGMMGYGAATIIATMTGLLCAYIFLYKCRKRLRPEGAQPGDDPLLVPAEMGSAGEVINLIIIVKYQLSLILEFAVFQVFLTPFERDFPAFAPAVLTAVGGLCATYVVLGGYRGVVKTDLFQVLVFVVACLAIIPTAWENAGTVSAMFTNPRARSFPDATGTLVWIAFTFACFAGFPDVWIRNFGTIPSTTSRGRRFWFVNLAALLAVFLPIIVLTAYGAQMKNVFDHVYDVDRAFIYYRDLYFNSSSSLFVKLLIAAAFLCIFVTTINTWLIGISQHAKAAPGLKSGRVYVLAPFAAVAVSVVGSRLVDGDTVYAMGLYLFPLLFISMFVLLYRAAPFLKTYSGPITLILSCFAGIVTTTTCLIARWDSRHENAPYIIWLTLIVMSAFVAASCGIRFAFINRNTSAPSTHE